MKRGCWRRNGYILLPVVLVLALVALLAMLLNLEGGMGMERVAGGVAATRAYYLAEAGLAHAGRLLSAGACADYGTLAAVPFGGGSYDVVIAPVAGSPVTLTATGHLPDGSAHTLVRTGVTAYEPPPAPLVWQPDAAAGSDTWLNGGDPSANNGARTVLKVAEAGGDRTLLRFDLDAVPAIAQVVSAHLELYLESATAAGSVDLHALNRAWVEGSGSGTASGDGATWLTCDGSNIWDTAGGDYQGSATASQQISATGAWYAWDVTALAAQWVEGSVDNQGVVLLGRGGLANAAFTASDSADADHRPRLTLTYACECGSGTSETWELQPGGEGKDTHITDGGKADDNYGSFIKMELTDDGLITTRTLIGFDLSDLNPAALVTGATLAVNLEGVGSFNGGTATLYRLTQGWQEMQVSWNEAEAGQPWTTTGGSHDPVAVAAADYHHASPGFVEWDVTSLVAGWHDGTYPNHGVMLVTTPGIDKAKFSSSEASNPAERPKLTVDYTCPCGVECLPPSEPLFTYRDEFGRLLCDAYDWFGSDGTLDWRTRPWSEVGESDGSCIGAVKILYDLDGPALRLTGEYRGAQRRADLSAFSQARLNFLYRRVDLRSDESLSILVSADGGTSWVELGRLEQAGTDTAYQFLSFPLDGFLVADFALCFQVKAPSGSVFIDDVQLDNLTAADSAAGVTVLEPAADTWTDATQAYSAHGAEVGLAVNGKANKLAHALLAFDLSGFAPGTPLTSAVLRLYVTANTNGQPGVIRVFPLGEDWSETAASWVQRLDGVSWAVPGGTYTTPELANFTVPAYATGAWYEVDITPQVAEWIDGVAANWGLLLTSDRDKVIEFTSRESADPVLRPQLVLTEP